MISAKSGKGILALILAGVCLFIFAHQKNYWNHSSYSPEKFVAPIETECPTGKPCVYDDEVDFRLIVITYNRAQSLAKLLRTIDELELDGDSGALEIWIDVNKQGISHNETVQVAKGFNWKKGPTRVHIQTSHAGIYGQWIDTWRPKNPDSKELALILEDDISISKYSYRWIKAVHQFYGSNPDFAGSSLTSDEQKSHDGSFKVLSAPKNDTIFMYKCIGTWGFSPRTSMWTDFQDWYHEHILKKDFHPYVANMVGTAWYKGFEASGRADTMWEQWLIYYTDKEKLFTIYNNLKIVNGDTKSCLCINRREVGLHVGSKGREDYCTLLDRWEDKFVSFSNHIKKLDWNGNAIDKY